LPGIAPSRKAKVVADHGWDSFAEREVDRIFAVLVEESGKTLSKVCRCFLAHGTGMAGTNDPDIALWRKADHFRLKETAVAVAKQWAD